MNASGKLTLAALIVTSALVTSACRKFKTSPYDTDIRSDLPRGLNAINISKLSGRPVPGDTVRVLVIADTQRFYEELDAFVEKANAMDRIDFVAVAGDLTDFGTAEEYEWICERLLRLRVPFVCAVGNHDLVANGSEIWDELFGERNFHFEHRGIRFIFHDTNGLEYGHNGTAPDTSYLQAALQTTLPCLAVSHVPPFADDFDPALELPYHRTLASNPRLLASIHGHLHGGLNINMYGDHVLYIVTPSVKARSATLLKLTQDGMVSSKVSF